MLTLYGYLQIIEEIAENLSICEIILLTCLIDEEKKNVEEILKMFNKKILSYGFTNKGFFDSLRSLEFQGIIKVNRKGLKILDVKVKENLEKEKQRLRKILQNKILVETENLKPEIFRKVLSVVELLEGPCGISLEKLQTILKNNKISQDEFEKALEKLVKWGFLYKPNPTFIKTVKVKIVDF